MVFVPQLYYKRENFFKTLGYLCYNKQTRSEIIALLLYILQEGIMDQSSLEAIYFQLCQRAKIPGTPDATKNDEPKTPVKGSRPSVGLGISASFPIGCTGATVATQAIDVIQYLLENESHMKFHFLSDQESNPFIRKMGKKHKLKDSSYKYPINILFNLLGNKQINEDTNLMDILSRTFQIATKPLQLIQAKLDEA
ncbi:unnamed protein product [Ambrosiozyma monospora]|uniref:Unnamed protein product n=1 Tax=Ambrosiozyma monospora TaxID=43982 RepID=A0ACB5UA90_AMBMO|nr:unnamed protein product [Ambrosiozyma monospora]